MLDWKRSKKSIQGALEIEEAVARCLRARLQYLEAELELAVLCNSTAEAATYRSQIEAACKSLASGATCNVSGPQGNVSGTCFAPQQGLALACRPKDAPAPGGAAPGSK